MVPLGLHVQLTVVNPQALNNKVIHTVPHRIGLYWAAQHLVDQHRQGKPVKAAGLAKARLLLRGW